MAGRAIDGGDQALFEIAPSADGAARLSFRGSWLVGSRMPQAADLIEALDAKGASRQVKLDGEKLVAWDTGFLTVVDGLERLGKARNLEIDQSGLPDGACRLLQLAESVPERAGARRGSAAGSLSERVGKRTLALLEGGGEVLAFLGEAILAFGSMLRGRPRFRRSRFSAGDAGGGRPGAADRQPDQLSGRRRSWPSSAPSSCCSSAPRSSSPIWSAIGMARDMAAMMVGIILAGRTGAAFAAQLGTMQVNEEIDALTTWASRPMQFLVLPRMLALILMTPLLVHLRQPAWACSAAWRSECSCSTCSTTVYLQQTWNAATPLFFIGGLIKATVYGIVVAVTGCLRGMQCGRSAAAVGDAATSAVVTSIVFIILAMATLTLIYNALGI